MFAEFLAQGGRRVIGCGTCAEYAVSDEPLSETDERTPGSLYGQTKRQLFMMLRTLPVSFAWARIFYPFGSGEGSRRFVPSVCQALAQGLPAHCSSGRQLRNFTDVRNIGAALAALVQHPLVGPINLGQPQSHRIADIAEMLGDIAGRPDLIALGALPDRDGEPAALVPDLQRQSEELKFFPRIAVRSGLNDAYQAWKNKMIANVSNSVASKPSNSEKA